MTDKVMCAYCGEEIEDPDSCALYGDLGTDYGGKPLHEWCYYEPEPYATVIYSEGGPWGGGEMPHIISACMNQTEGDFRAAWISTDAWRGYFQLESETYEQVHTDCILSGSRDSELLHEFDRILQYMMGRENIRYVRAFPRTSNVFSCGYELWVRKEDMARYGELIEGSKEAARKELRDPYTFNLTALTGKDPGECDDKDHLFALMGSLILARGEND